MSAYVLKDLVKIILLRCFIFPEVSESIHNVVRDIVGESETMLMRCICSISDVIN